MPPRKWALFFEERPPKSIRFGPLKDAIRAACGAAPTYIGLGEARPFVDFPSEQDARRAWNDGALEVHVGQRPLLLLWADPPKHFGRSRTGPARPQAQRGGGRRPLSSGDPPQRQRRPYRHILPRVEQAVLAPPVTHDGCGRRPDGGSLLSGEIRLTLEALTPLLVGNEQIPVDQCGLFETVVENDPAWRQAVGQLVDERKLRWRGRFSIGTGETRFAAVEGDDEKDSEDQAKKVLLPLRLDAEGRPVLLSGAGLLGMLRQAVGIVLDAPMHRVADQTYSYRPNAQFPNPQWSPYRLEPRPAIVKEVVDGLPTRIDIYRMQRPRFNAPGERLDVPYRGGIEGNREARRNPRSYLLAKAKPRRRDPFLHGSTESLRGHPQLPGEPVPEVVRELYRATLKHLSDDETGHISRRNPNSVSGVGSRLRSGWERGFEEGDLVYVEVEPDAEPGARIRSLGHHYYYRWRHLDTVRTRWAPAAGSSRSRWATRALLEPRDEELEGNEGLPAQLTGGRLLFGYAGELNSKEVAEQMAGRLAPNFAIEVLDRPEEERFLRPERRGLVSLRELGMPRPSAAEFYLHQDSARLEETLDDRLFLTYGDLPSADGSGPDDPPGELGGRKVYLHTTRAQAPNSDGTWLFEEDSTAGWLNGRASLARYVSTPGTRFRWTLRFRELRPWELALVLLVLCPDRFVEQLPEECHPADEAKTRFAHKLGHGRPLGMGSVAFRCERLAVLDPTDCLGELDLDGDEVRTAFRELRGLLAGRDLVSVKEWLTALRFDGSDWADYPRSGGEIYSWHTETRRDHLVRRRRGG